MTTAVTDFSQFAALRRGAEQNDPAALRAVAGQFEALFIETMLENMRDTSLGDPIFGKSDQYEMYRDMLDKQMSVEMASGHGIGLADMLVRQLGGGSKQGGEVGTVPTPGGAFRLPAAKETGAVASLPAWSSPVDFAKHVWPHAVRAAEKLNVAPEAILAQAALESGWGEHVMQRADGASSLNLFGIKAGAGWEGLSATRPTLEYADGIAHREQARFRAYTDIGATFDDYARLLGEHPRYTSVRNQGEDVEGFARALQEAGYATDPAYADKITNILRGDTMQKALGALKNFSGLPITGLQ